MSRRNRNLNSPREPVHRGRRVVRHRQQGRPPRGRQRPELGRQGDRHPLRLPWGRGVDRLVRGEGVLIKASSDERAKAVLDVFKEKLIKRGISLKALKSEEPQASGKEFRISATIQQGIPDDQAKAIAKRIRTEGPKGVQAQIQGDQLRVTGKKRDDLQTVIAMLKEADLDVPLQFTNYR